MIFLSHFKEIPEYYYLRQQLLPSRSLPIYLTIPRCVACHAESIVKYVHDDGIVDYLEFKVIKTDELQRSFRVVWKSSQLRSAFPFVFPTRAKEEKYLFVT
jgi:hypothetical protein